MRIGFGYDSHRFETAPTGKPLVLGGVIFPSERALVAHSDGDVVVHALIDALLGAAAKGDIGSHFPDTDERWRNADSLKLLAQVVRELSAEGFYPGNIDITIICERPKIGQKVSAMKTSICEVFNRALAGARAFPEFNLSIKGKTAEGLGDIGKGLGIEVHAVCLLKERDDEK